MFIGLLLILAIYYHFLRLSLLLSYAVEIFNIFCSAVEGKS